MYPFVIIIAIFHCLYYVSYSEIFSLLTIKSESIIAVFQYYVLYVYSLLACSTGRLNTPAGPVSGSRVGGRETTSANTKRNTKRNTRRYTKRNTRENTKHTFLFWIKSVSKCGDGWPNTIVAKKVSKSISIAPIMGGGMEKITKKLQLKPVMSFQVFLQSVNEVWNSWVGGVPVTAVCFRKLGNCFANACLCSDFQKYILNLL